MLSLHQVQLTNDILAEIKYLDELLNTDNIQMLPNGGFKKMCGQFWTERNALTSQIKQVVGSLKKELINELANIGVIYDD